MNCKYCGCNFKLTKLHRETNSCLECSGVVDDLTVEDSELQIDVWRLRNPSGKTVPMFETDNYEE